ncbi:MAG: hypothetical protein PHY15_06940 [Eubacteriales bacterium]|nr:hypothetical protein [Eubacteriales bacterium]MDD4475404.1 hypothetical protein [Eubacteriales bacterium]
MKKVLVVSAVILIILPILLIFYITYVEMEQYRYDDNYKIIETAYGVPSQVIRGTINESFELEGQFISKEFVFIDIDTSNENPIKFLYSVNDEVKAGDCLALIGDEKIYSQYNGIIADFSFTANDSYIKLLNLEKLMFECYYNGDLSIEESKTYTTTDNNKLTITSVSNIYDEQGRKIYAQVENDEYMYGQKAKFIVNTGVSYEDVLMIRKDCIYRKEMDGKHYIRRVKSNREVIGEVEVTPGISDGNMISITGLEEGWYCDPGYAKFLNN